MKFFIKDFFSKCDQIRSFLRISSHLLKKSLMKNFIVCAVIAINEDCIIANSGGITSKIIHKSYSGCLSSSYRI